LQNLPAFLGAWQAGQLAGADAADAVTNVFSAGCAGVSGMAVPQ
jgi:hypothetical protein